MNTIVIYSSETGFTKQYAEWIAERIGSNAYSISEVTDEMIHGFECIIYGGSIQAGMIKGYQKILNKGAKNLVIFAVGFSEESETIREQICKQNKLQNNEFFYFRGGLNYEKMGFVKRAMLKKITKQKDSIDYSNPESIEKLIRYIGENK